MEAAETPIPAPSKWSGLTGNGRVGGEGAQRDREAANAGSPESSSAVNVICRLIREQHLWPEDVIAILNATSSTLSQSNGHLQSNQRIVGALAHLSDWITDEVAP